MLLENRSYHHSILFSAQCLWNYESDHYTEARWQTLITSHYNDYDFVSMHIICQAYVLCY